MVHGVELAVEHVPGPAEAARRAVFLHGIFGRGANLRTIARRFVAARRGWDAWLVDLRGHGDSAKGAPEPSLAAAAVDVRARCAGSLPVAMIVGHSFGGKVALEMVRQGFGPARAPDGHALVPLLHVVTLDSNPGSRPTPHDSDSAPAVLEMLRAMPATFPSRAAFAEAVIARGRSRTLAGWLAQSTAPAPAGGVRLALDLAEIGALLSSYFAADLWPVVAAPPDAVFLHLIIGERSASYPPADRARAGQIAAQNARVTVDLLPTDHWVHAEDPDGLLRLLLARVPA